MESVSLVLSDFVTSWHDRQRTKCHSRVISTPASYSGSPEFDSGPEDQLSWQFLWFSLHLQASTDMISQNRPKLVPSTSIPYHFTKSSYLRRCITNVVDEIPLNKPIFHESRQRNIMQTLTTVTKWD